MTEEQRKELESREIKNSHGRIVKRKAYRTRETSEQRSLKKTKKKTKKNINSRSNVVLSDEVYLQMIIELEDELLKNERSGAIIKQEIADKYEQSFWAVESIITRYTKRSKSIPKRIYKTGSARWGTLKYHEGVDPKEGTYNYERNVTQEQKDNATKKNKENHRKYTREYTKEKYHKDPVFNIRSKLSGMSRRFAGGKRKSSFEQLGSSYENFLLYLGDKKEGDELDHVIPISWALTIEEAECLTHYSNFQWLNKIDNIKKGNNFCRKENVERVYENHNNLDLLNKIIERNLNKIK